MFTDPKCEAEGCARHHTSSRLISPQHLPVKVGAHVPEQVEGQLASLLLAVELIALLGFPQLICKGVPQLVFPHVLLQLVQPADDLGVCLEAGAP